MTSTVLTFLTFRAILAAKSVIPWICVLMQYVCLGTFQVYNAASLLGVTETGATHLPCSRTMRITMLTALVEKAGNAMPKMLSNAIALAFSSNSEAGNVLDPMRRQELNDNDGNYKIAILRVYLQIITWFSVALT